MTDNGIIVPELTAHPRRVLLMDVSDSHGGNRFGLLNPSTVLHDENPLTGKVSHKKVDPNASQEFIWEAYSKHMATVRDAAGPDEIIVLHNGDATQGTKHPELLVSDRPSDQVMIARDNLRPCALGQAGIGRLYTVPPTPY